VNGRVTRKSLDLGQLVQPGTGLMSIVYGQPWVVANFKETQLAHMKVGQAVEIRVDAYPDLLLHGHVDSIQAGTGARFSILPAENATGNFVKVVQRVPVKILLDEKPEQLQRLAPGMSVAPKVRTGS
jgi:membrane fusion protein (multidrug efflux system)